MKIRMGSLWLGIWAFGSISCWALEIPLSGAQGGEAGGGRIGYVDMERVFQLYPQTRDAKEDYFKKREKMREDLTLKERKLEEVKQKQAILEATLLGLQKTGNATVSGSTATVVQPIDMNIDSITQTKKELEVLQSEYEAARKNAEADLIAFEKRQTQIILGKIFEALKELAEEEQVALVVDKSSILYGSADIDLTDKLQQRVRGY